MSKIMSLRLLPAWIGTIAIWMFLTGTAQAQTPASQNQAVTEIVRLQHRAPASIRAAIEPHLDPRGAISQIDNSLIISTSRANLTQLQQLIGELDIPRRQIRLSVDFDYGQPPASALPDSTSVTTTATPSTRQSIVVTEGESVWFQSDSLTPVVVPSFTEHGAGLLETSRGEVMAFGANVELRDNRAVLRIAMTQSEAEGVSADLQNRLLNTTVELAPGEWFVLNAPPEDDALMSDADSRDFSDFSDFNSTAPETNSSSTVSTSTQDLLAIQVELL